LTGSQEIYDKNRLSVSRETSMETVMNRLMKRGLTVLAFSMATLTISLPAAAAGRNAGKNVVHKCGIITCSDYYSHEATVMFDQAMQKGDFTTAANAGEICAVGGAGMSAVFKLSAGELVAIPCGAIAAVSQVVGNVQNIIHHAATSNGCMRFQHPRGANSISVAVYADHSSLCHSMDK
jgi:hypothetical protein